jgi:hypothetical protein
MELMFSTLAYGLPPPLDPPEYVRRLYEANVRPELLEYIAHEYNFHPGVFVRALHEGGPIDYVNRTLDWNYSVSSEVTRHIGDIYLLVFATVALRRYDELNVVYCQFVEQPLRDFLGSLEVDGFHYQSGRIVNQQGQPVTPIPLGSTSEINAAATIQEKESEPTSESPRMSPTGISKPKPAKEQQSSPARQRGIVERRLRLGVSSSVHLRQLRLS